jgi:DNA polymerase (family 10)
LKGKLPKLVNDHDLRGILHCHTDASDGTETLETMAKATRQRGFEYFGVADHSKSAHYAGGLSVEEIAQQHREADRLNLQRVHIDVISVASDKGIETKGVRAQRGRNGTA